MKRPAKSPYVLKQQDSHENICKTTNSYPSCWAQTHTTTTWACVFVFDIVFVFVFDIVFVFVFDYVLSQLLSPDTYNYYLSLPEKLASSHLNARWPGDDIQ